MKDQRISVTHVQMRNKLREEFMKHRDVKDIRVMDYLNIKVLHFQLLRAPPCLLPAYNLRHMLVSNLRMILIGSTGVLRHGELVLWKTSRHEVLSKCGTSTEEGRILGEVLRKSRIGFRRLQSTVSLTW